MEDYLGNLLDHIEGPYGPLKDSSKGIYLTRVLDIYDYLVESNLIKRKTENLKFIEVHISSILEYISTINSFNTRKSYLTALLVILRTQDPSKFKGAISALNEEMKKMKDHQDERYSKKESSRGPEPSKSCGRPPKSEVKPVLSKEQEEPVEKSPDQ